jgi:hypothetical protein
MNDKQAIDFLRRKLDPDGGSVKTAEALHVTPQVVTNWRRRGISPSCRYDVWHTANEHGAKLDVSWLRPRTKKAA